MNFDYTPQKSDIATSGAAISGRRKRSSVVLARRSGSGHHTRMNEHIIIAAVMIAGFGLAVAPSFISKDRSPDSAARDICANTIRAGLHNPRSVEWVNRNSWQSTPRGGGGLTITATYRATNAFGATVLNTTECEVSFNGGRYTVQALN